jgi:hypothetical protein
MIGACFVDTPSHTAVFGLHQQIGRGFGSKTMPILHDLTAALNETTLRHIEGLFGIGVMTSARRCQPKAPDIISM